MDMAIVDAPISFDLHGIMTTAPNRDFARAGVRSMDAMWAALRAAGTPNTGINHWVYLPDDALFVGVELAPGASAPAPLEPLRVELGRHLQHLHVGPYQALPAKWQALKAELAARGETLIGRSLEIYGHHTDDPAKLETTILIGLRART